MNKTRTGKLNHGDRVEVYRNLHNNTFSIRRNGKVVKHLENWMTLHLKDVKFAVQPAGREKVRREGKKNVHAFIRGTVEKYGDTPYDAYTEGLLSTTPQGFPKEQEMVSYNPYHTDHFGYYKLTGEFDKKGRPCNAWTHIFKANQVTLNQGTVYAAI
jgi:hypothetical protein